MSVELFELEDCPICREGVGSVEHEGGWCVYVECLQCGSHTAHFSYKNDAEKAEAEKASKKKSSKKAEKVEAAVETVAEEVVEAVAEAPAEETVEEVTEAPAEEATEA